MLTRAVARPSTCRQAGGGAILVDPEREPPPVIERTARRTVAIHALVALLAIQGVSGLLGGVGLIADPGGQAVGLPLEWLRGSPFDDYFVPGLVLLTVLGIGPLVVSLALWRARPWSRVGAILVGLALLVWIGVQILVVGYRAEPPLQAAYGLLGMMITVLAALPPVRRYVASNG